LYRPPAHDAVPKLQVHRMADTATVVCTESLQ
jgi:hypothetical protein